MEGVKMATRNLKNNKGDEVMEHLEIIKYGVNKLLDRIYGLVRQIWNEE
jgi:hypothetical protein